MCASHNNNNEIKENILINILIHYLIRNQSLPRRTTSLRINPTIYERFFWTCRKLGLLKRGHSNVAIEGLMQFFIEKYEDTPSVIQTTLLLEKPNQPKHELSIATRLELKIVKTDLANILDSCQKGLGHETWRESRLKEVVEKAVRVYENTRDKDLATLLGKAEAFV